MSFLPYNATKLERAVEQAIKYNVDPKILAGFKFAATGKNINLALSWEYSLAQINVDDFKERIIEGLKFHRLRGTPYALRQALSWYDFDDVKIEEELPGEHFSEFQIGLREIPNDLDIDKIVAASTMASPLRSRLSRMYNELYDIRRFILDQSAWGDFLSDHSGNTLYDGSPKFSFGRINNFSVATNFANTHCYRIAYRFVFAKNYDTYKLDWAILDESDKGTLNYGHSRLSAKFVSNGDSVCDKLDKVFETRKIARALVVLSEDCTLEDINSCFSCGHERITIEPFTLDFSYLSENAREYEQQLISYRDFEEISANAANTFERKCRECARNRELCAIVRSNFGAVTTTDTEMNLRAQYLGNNTWTNQKHFDVPWLEQKNYLGRLV